MHIRTTYEIDQFRDNPNHIALALDKKGGHYVMTRDKKPTLVAISYREYEDLAETAEEMQSTKLARSVRKARKEYSEGKARDFNDFLKDLYR